MTIKVSTVIPIYNEEYFIAKFLDSLERQDYPKDVFELLLINGMSDDGTIKKIKDFFIKSAVSGQWSENEDQKTSKIKEGNNDIFNVRILDNPKRIVPCGLNIGIKEAKGEYILRMDAHTEYASDYISKCVEWLEKTRAENVGGPMRAKGKGYVGMTAEFAHHSKFGLGGGKFHNENYSGYVDTVYLGAWPKKVFDEIGYFDERLARNQDIEFNSRIRKAGGKIYLTPEIKSYYHCRNTLVGLWKQNFENGKWVIYTKAIAPYCLSWRHFVPLIFVLSLLTSLLLAPYSLVAAIIFLIVSGSYVLSNLFFSAILSFKNSFKYLLPLLIVFGTLHLSYGFGSIWGLLALRKWIKENPPTEG